MKAMGIVQVDIDALKAIDKALLDLTTGCPFDHLPFMIPAD
jgi:hypothetical protein